MNKLVKLLKAVGLSMLVVIVLIGLAVGVNALVDWLVSINSFLALIPLVVIICGLLIPMIYSSL